MLIPLPGEERVRDLTKSANDSAINPLSSCAYYYLCVYQYQNYGGARLDLMVCDVTKSIPWTGTGSYYNNQTPGTQGTFYRYDGSIHSYTKPAIISIPNNPDWTPIYSFKAC